MQSSKIRTHSLQKKKKEKYCLEKQTPSGGTIKRSKKVISTEFRIVLLLRVEGVTQLVKGVQRALKVLVMYFLSRRGAIFHFHTVAVHFRYSCVI